MMGIAAASRPLLGVASSSRVTLTRGVHDFIRGRTPGGTYKVPLSSPNIVGTYSSRGARLYQEDTSSACGLQLPPAELRSNYKERLKTEWNPTDAGNEFFAGQVGYFGIFDGHGGQDVSTYLKENLHRLTEEATRSQIPDIVSFTQKHGGYFKRWRGGALQRWTKNSLSEPATDRSVLSMEERLTLAFLTADKAVLETIDKAQRCGATATVALLHSLDSPAEPYWSASKLCLTTAHCGDTRAILCKTDTGEAVTLTENHHAESRVESARLRRMGGDRLVSDSFGESRWMGVVENTRSIGDGEWKPSGITAEPEVRSQIIDGNAHAYLVLASDGLTSLITDQEIVDLARTASDPSKAARAIVSFGEDLDAQDNCTCVVIPLKGWGKVGGADITKDRREYRKRQAGSMSTRMQRM